MELYQRKIAMLVNMFSSILNHRELAELAELEERCHHAAMQLGTSAQIAAANKKKEAIEKMVMGWSGFRCDELAAKCLWSLSMKAECPICEHELNEEDLFCSQCGAERV